MTYQTIGVVGAGNIGTSLMVDLVLHGIHAVGVDLSEGILARARDEIAEAVRFAPMLDKGAPRLARDEAMARITLSTRLEDIAACEFVVENVTEDWETKRRLYERLDAIAPPAVCFGANTSCIPIARIAAATRRPGQVIGVHFMNPVHLMRAVEVIRGERTSDQTVEQLNRLFAQLRKKAVMVGDGPGFVSNRISHLFMNEAARVLQEGLATAAQIDAIFKQCFGHKMGPLETADLIGLDTVMRSLDVLHDAFKDPKYRCCPLMRQLVAAGHCGRKSGRGFHAYADAPSLPGISHERK